MTSDKGKAFWLGLFVIIAIGTIAWLLLFLKPSVGDGHTTLTIRFANIEGVNIGTRVNFGGKPVGTVTAIKEIFNARSNPPDEFGNYYFYEVVAKVDSKVKVYSYEQISLTTQGLLGEKSIEISPTAAPAGAPPPKLVNDDVLYARGGDRIQTAIDDFNHLIGKISKFVDDTKPILNESLNSITTATQTFNCLIEETLSKRLISKSVIAANAVTCAMKKANEFLDDMKNYQLVERLANAATGIENTTNCFEEVACKLKNGEGTLGRLLTSDSLYLQLTATMCRLESVLTDINNYGLLFQYDRKWQRQRNTRLKEPCCTEDFESCMSDISTSLERIQRALQKENDANLSENHKELIGRVEHLVNRLQSFEVR